MFYYFDWGVIMAKEILQILLLAAASDGQIDPEEQQLLETYRKHYPPIRDLSQEEFNSEAVSVFNKINAGMKPQHIVEIIGEQLSDNEKNTAYALAVEICAANFAIVPPENDFLTCIETQWKIKKKIIEAVKLSSQLRY